MIPVKLSVRNFMCYRDEAVHVDLERVHMACLSGENGAGKSALLDSITWAGFGGLLQERREFRVHLPSLHCSATCGARS